MQLEILIMLVMFENLAANWTQLGGQSWKKGAGYARITR